MSPSINVFRLIADEPLQTPLVNKFFNMELDQHQVHSHQSQFNRAMRLVEDQEEHKEGEVRFQAHNPSSSLLFGEGPMILEKRMSNE